jgi:hypothetical protein
VSSCRRQASSVRTRFSRPNCVLRSLRMNSATSRRVGLSGYAALPHPLLPSANRGSRARSLARNSGCSCRQGGLRWWNVARRRPGVQVHPGDGRSSLSSSSSRGVESVQVVEPSKQASSCQGRPHGQAGWVGRTDLSASSLSSLRNPVPVPLPLHLVHARSCTKSPNASNPTVPRRLCSTATVEVG